MADPKAPPAPSDEDLLARLVDGFPSVLLISKILSAREESRPPHLDERPKRYGQQEWLC